MARVAALAAVLGIALAAGAAAPAKVEGRLFGLLGTPSGQFVLELDPETLQALPSRRLKLAVSGPGAPWSLDPSRHTLAIARNGRLRIVDLVKLRFVGRAVNLGRTEAAGVLWLRPERIVVLQRSADHHDYEITVVDARRPRVVSRRRLSGGSVVDSERTDAEVVVLRSPAHSIGPARLLVLSSDGSAREVALPRITAGARWEEDVNPPVGRHERPALAVDEARRIAYVVAPNGLVAEVPLDGDGSDVHYHAVRGRFAKVLAGSSRQAHFVGGRIAVTGSDSELVAGTNGSVGSRTTPAGLELIDPRTWETRRVAPAVSALAPWRGGLVATGTGLSVHDLDGAERFRVLDGKRLWISFIYADRAYVWVEDEEALAVVDLVTGQLVERRPGTLMPWLLLEQGSPIW